MSKAQTILTRARKLGLRLCLEGDRIAISPNRQCPPDLLAEFREHKPDVMALLAESNTVGLASDCAPWLHVARQVVEGEFDAVMDGSVRSSLEIGLRSIPHPLCPVHARLVVIRWHEERGDFSRIYIINIRCDVCRPSAVRLDWGQLAGTTRFAIPASSDVNKRRYAVGREVGVQHQTAKFAM